MENNYPSHPSWSFDFSNLSNHQTFNPIFYNKEGNLSLANFTEFFSNKYYFSTIINSLKLSIIATATTIILATPIAYFMSFYKIRGAKVLEIIIILASMSAPFIGAYSWILLLGRNGIITNFLLVLA